MVTQLLIGLALAIFAVAVVTLLRGGSLYSYVFGIIAGPMVLLSLGLVFLSLQIYGLPTGVDQPLLQAAAPVIGLLGFLAAAVQAAVWIVRALRGRGAD